MFGALVGVVFGVLLGWKETQKNQEANKMIRRWGHGAKKSCQNQCCDGTCLVVLVMDKK